MRDKMIEAIMEKFRGRGMTPRIHKIAQSGSAYIKFDENVNGTLRIADHPQRKRYSYRWNLRLDFMNKQVKYKPHTCYYYPLSMLDEMIDKMRDLACANGVLEDRKKWNIPGRRINEF